MFTKGHVPWNRGLTKETDPRVAACAVKSSTSHKGHIPWNKGLTKDTEHRLGGGRPCGGVPWNKGLTIEDPRVARSVEAAHQSFMEKLEHGTLRQKLSQAHKDKPLTLKQMESYQNRRGKPRPVDECKKISQTLKGKHDELSAMRKQMWQRPHYRENKVLAWSRAQHKKPNEPETSLLEILNRHFSNEWKYTGDGSLVIGGYIPDFANCNGRKELIEVFGDYWHNRPKTPWHQTELGRIGAYNSLGFRCLVIWEHELKTLPEQEIVEKIRTFTQREGRVRR